MEEEDVEDPNTRENSDNESLFNEVNLSSSYKPSESSDNDSSHYIIISQPQNSSETSDVDEADGLGNFQTRTFVVQPDVHNEHVDSVTLDNSEKIETPTIESQENIYTDIEDIQNEEIYLESEESPAADTLVIAGHDTGPSADLITPEQDTEPLTDQITSELDIETLPASVAESPTKKSRKIVRNPKKWKNYILKECHQKGKSYTNQQGKQIPARKIKNLKDCLNNCKFKCSTKISESERKNIFDSYYKLSQNEKHQYILFTTDRHTTVRPKANQENRYKKYSFRYYFKINNDKIQVCKKFYLGTLSISQKPVYNTHNNKDLSNTPKPDSRGKNNPRKIPEEKIQLVKDHISSFPTVESHYCRKTTARQFLESFLTLQKMYQLYLEYCRIKQVESVKYSMYRFIFNTQFNLSFHIRKTDLCDLCEEYKIYTANKSVSDQLQSKYEKHIIDKNAMRTERNHDREAGVPVLSFDLQNVITLPQSEISSFFYKSKLTVYNLTAYYSVSKTIYCAIWTELDGGRGGNDIASAFIKILEKVVEENDVTNLITWSDSCVPQNRNSFISSAVIKFISDNPQISDIIMKYSVPGHSCIQEVDSAHSAIEKAMSKVDVFSTIGLLRLLKSMDKKNPIRVIQMKKDDFKNYDEFSKQYNFEIVPIFKICAIRFTDNLFQSAIKTSFTQNIYQLRSLRIPDRPIRKYKSNTPRSGRQELSVTLKILKKGKENKKKMQKKVKDIKSLLKYMPLQDRKYYETILKL